MAMVCLVLSLLATVVAGKRTVVTDKQDIRAKADKAHETSQCDVEEHGKVDCGFVGVTQDMCEGMGCCWQPSTPGGGTPWCFFDKNTVSEVRTVGVVAGSDGSRGQGAGLYVMIQPADARDRDRCEEHDSSDLKNQRTKEEKPQETPQCTWMGLQQTNTKGVATFNVPESCGLGPFMTHVYPEDCPPFKQHCEHLKRDEQRDICLNFPLNEVEALVGRTVYEEGTIYLDATKTRPCTEGHNIRDDWTPVAECLKTNCKDLQYGHYCDDLNYSIMYKGVPDDCSLPFVYPGVQPEKELFLWNVCPKKCGIC